MFWRSDWCECSGTFGLGDLGWLLPVACIFFFRNRTHNEYWKSCVFRGTYQAARCISHLYMHYLVGGNWGKSEYVFVSACRKGPIKPPPSPLVEGSDTTSRRRGDPISKQLKVGTRNQDWLCWRVSAEMYPTDSQLGLQDSQNHETGCVVLKSAELNNQE